MPRDAVLVGGTVVKTSFSETPAPECRHYDSERREKLRVLLH